MHSGLYTALITPFKIDKSIDIKAFEDLVKFQISAGVDGLVVIGTTGESPTLSFEERDLLVKKCVELASKRVPVLVGTGSNSTDITLKYTQHAKDCRADGALIVCPYYNKPSQEGLYQHFKYINDNVDFPIMLYNAPGRTVVSLDCDTIGRLSKLKNIMGIKDCAGSNRPLQISQCVEKDFAIMSGDDPDMLAFNANGGMGCISVISNILPKECKQIQKMTQEGRYKEARTEFQKITSLIDLMFCESNPVPVKYALSEMGKCLEDVRLPLVALKQSNKEKIKSALKELNIIK